MSADITPPALHASTPPSRRQQIVDDSDALTVNVAMVALIAWPAAGPAVNVTVGRVRSIVHARVTGAPAPTASAPVAENVVAPAGSPAAVTLAALCPGAVHVAAPPLTC